MVAAPYDELIALAADHLHAHETPGWGGEGSRGRRIGHVAAALRTTDGSTFAGVCVDTGSGTGFCAEASAIAAMLTAQQQRIAEIVAVWRNGATGELHALPPCGRCREFIHQIDPANLDTEVVLERDRSMALRELLPETGFPAPLK